MPNGSEIIKELAAELERRVIIADLKEIKSMEELQEYIKILEAKSNK